MWKRKAISVLTLAVFACAGVGAGLDEALEKAIEDANWTMMQQSTAPRAGAQGMLGTIVLGYASLSSGDYATALDAFARASSAPGLKAEAALGSVEVLLRKHPRSWVAHLLRADILARMDRYDDALASATASISHQPQAALGYHVRGLIHALAGHNEEAVEDFGRAIQRDARLADSHCARGIVRLRMGETLQAEEDLAKAIAIVPRFAVAANARAVAFCRLGRYEEALRLFRLAAELAPEFEAAAANADVAEFLASRERARGGIKLLASARAGTMGTRDITVVVADSSQIQKALDVATNALQKTYGVAPIIVNSPSELANLSPTERRPIIVTHKLPVFPGDGDSVMRALRDVNTFAPNSKGNVITRGWDGAEQACSGVTRYLLNPQQTLKVNTVSLIDYTEVGGLAGKTPLAGGVDLGRLTRSAHKLRTQGIGVAGFTSEGKLGLQHIGNVSAFQRAGLPVYATKWDAAVTTGLGANIGKSKVPIVPGLSIGVGNASDSAAAGGGMPERTWSFKDPSGKSVRFRTTLADVISAEIKPRPCWSTREDDPLTTAVILSDMVMRGGGGKALIAGSGPHADLMARKLAEHGIDYKRVPYADPTSLQISAIQTKASHILVVKPSTQGSPGCHSWLLDRLGGRAPQGLLPSSTDRGGVYGVGDDNLQVIDARGARREMPSPVSRKRQASPDAVLQCPFLVFPVVPCQE